MRRKELILNVLSMYSDPEQREREIKNMSSVFKVLAEEILPVHFPFPEKGWLWVLVWMLLPLSVCPPGFTCPAVLWIQLAASGFRIRDFHPL